MESALPRTNATADPDAASPPARQQVRGGVSLVAMGTGAVLVCAATTILILMAMAVASYAGYKPYRLPLGGMHRVGLTAAVGVCAGLFLAHLWGGYAAGRMARGAGWMNGILVAIMAGVLLMAGLIVYVLVRPGTSLAVKMPSALPRIHFLLPKWVNGLAAAAVGLVGATLGGIWGARWHISMERRADREAQETVEARATFRDLREAMAQPDLPAAEEADGPAVPIGPVKPAPTNFESTNSAPTTFEPGEPGLAPG